MSLDREPMKVSTAMRLAKQYYTKEGYEHASRVASYVAENMVIPFEYRDECIALAFVHDLLEDTDFNFLGDFPSLGAVFNKYENQILSPKKYRKLFVKRTDSFIEALVTREPWHNTVWTRISY